MCEAKVSEVASSEDTVSEEDATKAFPAPVPVKIVFAATEERPVPPPPTEMVEEPVMLFVPFPRAKPVRVVMPVPPFKTESAEVAETPPFIAKSVPFAAPMVRFVIFAFVEKTSVAVALVMVAFVPMRLVVLRDVMVARVEKRSLEVAAVVVESPMLKY